MTALKKGEKLKLYPGSQPLKVLSIVFIVLLLYFIWYTFQGNLLVEIRHALGAKRSYIQSSTVGVVINIVIFLIVGVSAILGKIRLDSLGKVLLLLGIYIVVQNIFTIRYDRLYIINTSLAATMWIIFYFGWQFFFRGLTNSKLFVERYTIVAFVYCSILFLYNYTVSRSYGLKGFHYIEVNFLLTLLPMVLMLKKKKMLVLFFVTAILTLLSAKRASTLTFLVAIFFYVIYSGKTLSSKINTIISAIVVGAICVFAISIAFPKNFQYTVDRFSELESDGGSGRDEAYDVLFSKFFDQDLSAQLLGNGYDYVASTDLNNGFSAHNDFLEVAYDYGLVGLSFYIIIYVMIYQLSNNRLLYREERIACKVSLVIYLILSMISHLILYTTSIVWLITLWAYLGNCINSRKNYLRIKRF